VPIKDPSKINKVEGTGSAWNNNSYQWEEKNVDKWATETIEKVLKNFAIKEDKLTFSVKSVNDLVGESSVSIRRQKKIVTYEYSVCLEWSISDGTIEATGFFNLPEISNDVLESGDEWQIDAKITKVEDKTMEYVTKMINQIPRKLRKEIQEKFVDELTKK